MTLFKGKKSMNNNNFLDKYGQWALVTGASSGLGKEIAFHLGQIGLNVLIQGRNQDKLEEVAEHITAMGVETKMILTDISTDDAVARMQQEIDSYDIGCFVGAAGFGTSGEFVCNSLADELDMMDVNCRAIVTMTHYFAQRFAAQKRGGIILFGSLVGFQGTPFAANYAATKAYMQILAEGLHYELKPKDVNVLCVAPGPVATGFGARADMKMNGAANPALLAPEIVKALGRKITVKPGFKSKFLLFSLAMFPRWARIRIMANVMGGMTKHQG